MNLSSVSAAGVLVTTTSAAVASFASSGKGPEEAFRPGSTGMSSAGRMGKTKGRWARPGRRAMTGVMPLKGTSGGVGQGGLLREDRVKEPRAWLRLRDDEGLERLERLRVDREIPKLFVAQAREPLPADLLIRDVEPGHAEQARFHAPPRAL